MARMSTVLLAAAVALIPTILAENAEHRCEAFTDCHSCTDFSRWCSWALVYNCSWMCLNASSIKDFGHNPVTGNPLKSDYWRYNFSYPRNCDADIEREKSCVEVPDNMNDRSFEKDNVKSEWIYARKIGLKDSTFSGDVYNPVDGKQYLVVGSMKDEGHFDYRITNPNIRIPKNATHLSLYYMTKLHHKEKTETFNGTKHEKLDDYTSFTIMLDGSVLFNFDKYNYEHYLTYEKYKILEVRIDDAFKEKDKNTLVITFTEKLTNKHIKEEIRDFIFVDYVQIIKKNGNQ